MQLLDDRNPKRKRTVVGGDNASQEYVFFEGLAIPICEILIVSAETVRPLDLI